MAGWGKATVPEGSFFCQHSKDLSNQGFSGVTALGMLGMQLLEWAPCLGLLSTLPYFVKLGSPHPRPVECSSQSFIAHMLKPLCNKRK